MATKFSLVPRDFGGQQLHSVADPTSAQDVATKNYVDTGTLNVQKVADAAATATATNDVVAYTSLSAARVVTLPAASLGRSLSIVDLSGSATPAITIGVARAGTDTIDGSASNFIVINSPRGGASLVADGVSNWTVFTDPAPWCNVQTYGAKGDGSTDDSTAIQAAYNAVPVGGTVFFPPPASYYKITTTLVCATAQVSTLGFGHPEVRQTGTILSSYDPNMLNINAADCSVKGVFFHGAGRADGTSSNGCGIDADVTNGTGHRLLVQDCKFLYCGNAPVCIQGCLYARILGNDVNCASDETGATIGTNSEGIWIKNESVTSALYAIVANNTIRNVDSESIIVTNAQQVAVTGNNIAFCSTGIAFYASTINTSDCVCAGNVIYSSTNGSPVAAIFAGNITGSAGGRCQRIAITGNTIRTCNNFGISVGNPGLQFYPVTGGTYQTAASSTSTSITASSTPSLPTWTTNQWAGYTVILHAGTGSGQTRLIYSNTATVLTIAGGTEGVVWATNPDATTTYYISEQCHTDIDIVGNTISGTGADAIVAGGSRTAVMANSITAVTGRGINCGGVNSVGCILSSNTVRGCTSDGIWAGALCSAIGNYADNCGAYLYVFNGSPTSGAKYRGNLCGPTNGTGYFNPGSEQETFYGALSIGEGPSGFTGYLAFNAAYNGANWVVRQGGAGAAAFVIWNDITLGQLHFGASPSVGYGNNNTFTPSDAFYVTYSGNTTFVGNPSGPTQSVHDNSLHLATTAYVEANPYVAETTHYAGVATAGNGLTACLAASDLTAQAAAQAGTALLASTPATGNYTIEFCAVVTTAATTSSTLGGSTGFTVTYTDYDTNASVTTVLFLTGTPTNAIGSQLHGSVPVHAKTGTAITYSFGYTTSGTTTMKYAIHVRCIWVG